jgi:hypothetical protein
MVFGPQLDTRARADVSLRVGLRCSARSYTPALARMFQGHGLADV